MVEAIRADRLNAFREGIANDPRPLVVEHLEDQKGRARTQAEVRRLIDDRLDGGHRVFLTLTLVGGESWRASEVLARRRAGA
jgi:hypothetical protein